MSVRWSLMTVMAMLRALIQDSTSSVNVNQDSGTLDQGWDEPEIVRVGCIITKLNWIPFQKPVHCYIKMAFIIHDWICHIFATMCIKIQILIVKVIFVHDFNLTEWF